MICFNCPTCGAALSVPDEKAGKIGKCVCGERVRVPGTPPTPMAVSGSAPTPVHIPQASSLPSIPKLPNSTVASAVPPKGLIITPKMWVLIIAGGVVLGLFVWTLANGLMAEWLKAKEEAEKQQKKEEQDRRHAEDKKRWDRELEEESKRQQQEFEKKRVKGLWTEIIHKAGNGEGTVRERVENCPEYQQRIREIGRIETLKEEREHLLSWIDFLEHINRDVLGNQEFRRAERVAEIANLKIELRYVERQLHRR